MASSANSGDAGANNNDVMVFSLHGYASFLCNLIMPVIVTSRHECCAFEATIEALNKPRSGLQRKGLALGPHFSDGSHLQPEFGDSGLARDGH